MSSLQIGLIIAGGLLLAVMLVYNAWLTRKNQPRQPDPSPADAQPDPAAGPEPVFEDAAFEPEVQLPLLPIKPAPTLDALIDVIAPIGLENLVSGQAVLAALPPTRRVGSKPFAIEGLNAATQVWEQAQAGQRYSSLQAGVQLANRAGALNEIEYSEFVIKTQNFCDALAGTPDFPDMLEQVARARELDSFAAEHDAQLEFFLRARQTAWTPAYVQQSATALGFVVGLVAGRLVLPSGQAGAPPLLHLSFAAQSVLLDEPARGAIRELTLHLDLPQIAREQQAFAQMRRLARALAESLDALLTDERGVALTDAALDVIAAELDGWYDTLERRELSAGSALARRLFS